MKPKPEWHSEETWEIETLDWKHSAADFDRLCFYVASQLRSELLKHDLELFSVVQESEFRYEVRAAAEAYSERHKIIGLAIHTKLWLRAFVSTKMKNEEWR